MEQTRDVGHIGEQILIERQIAQGLSLSDLIQKQLESQPVQMLQNLRMSYDAISRRQNKFDIEIRNEKSQDYFTPSRKIVCIEFSSRETRRESASNPFEDI